MGRQEYHYNEVARKCGISVPDFKLMNDRYFASRRFDISMDGERIHTATSGGLLSVSLSNPVLDYVNLLALTGYLTQSLADVEEMYRRMVFNYLAENKDDHCKNFSFFVTKGDDKKWHWHLYIDVKKKERKTSWCNSCNSLFSACSVKVSRIISR